MTTTDQINALNGLLQEIILDKDNDDLRLIYADLLDDSGKEQQAAFIRVQIAAAKLSCVESGDTFSHPVYFENEKRSNHNRCYTFGCKRCVLEEQADELLFANSGFVTLPPWVSQVEFSRGFIWYLRADLAKLIEHLPAFLRSHPVELVYAGDVAPSFIQTNRERLIEEEQYPDHWTWWREDDEEYYERYGTAGMHYLPVNIWNELKGFSFTSRYPDAKDYLSLREATADLSRVLIKQAIGG